MQQDHSDSPPIVISIGGAVLVPATGINISFLQKFNQFIRQQVRKGRRFFLVAGGGALARQYRDAGQIVIGNLTDHDLDWLGIHSTRLNAHLLRTIFADIAYPRIIKDYDQPTVVFREPVVIGAGWKPGWSTDYNAVILARDYQAKMIINLSNIDWVYDKDPKIFSSAKPIKKITWEEMEKLVGTKWRPGINAPFDPVATQLAKKLKISVIVANGQNLDNLKRIVEGEEFIGTTIVPG